MIRHKLRDELSKAVEPGWPDKTSSSHHLTCDDINHQSIHPEAIEGRITPGGITRESAKAQEHEQHNGPKERSDAAHDGPESPRSPEQAHQGPGLRIPKLGVFPVSR